MANTNIQRSISGSATDGKKFTLSGWFKLTSTTAHMGVLGSIYSAWNGRGNAQLGVYNNRPYFWYKNEANNAKYIQDGDTYLRDLNAWYHIVWVFDSTQSTASDRMKIYVNNKAYTPSTTLYPPQNEVNGFINDGHSQYVGKFNFTDGSVNYWNGCMSHLHLCDGYAYSPSDFGETDTTTGEWKIKTTPNVNYGNHGWWLFKDDNSLTDQSSNTNNFSTHNGTLTKTEDNPSNIFNTFNLLVPSNSTTFTNGNTTLTSGSTQWNGAMTTIPLYGGKWYYECKYINGGNIKFDVTGEKSDYSHMATLNSAYGGYNDNGYGYQFNNSGNDYIGNNDSFPNWGGGLSSNTGDKIFMIALDLDNGKIWYGADGTWFNDASGYTGNPSTGAYPHQTISATHLAQKPFIVTGSLEGNSDVAHWNFGNGYFGTTAISSEGTNASGIGKFEYDVPNGFTAISTKGLNE